MIFHFYFKSLAGESRIAAAPWPDGPWKLRPPLRLTARRRPA